MRNTLAAIGRLTLGLAVTWAIPASAFEVESQTSFGDPGALHELRILSTADTSLFAPMLRAFVATAPDLRIDYVTVSSANVMEAIVVDKAGFDLAISSAMDLQTKLANDGYTLPHASDATALVPDWASWRGHVFAFTMEPAAIVVNRQMTEGMELPRTRADWISLLRDRADIFAGRVGTYDVRDSGLGYLFATQDARASESYWRLTEVMGQRGTALYCCSGQMIEDVASGRLAFAYNVLASYAEARTDLRDAVEIVTLEDFATVMLRSAVIPTTASRPELGAQFLDYLLQAAWNGQAPEAYPFPPIPSAPLAGEGGLRPIPLGPGLLVYLDQQKRAGFLEAWSDALVQGEQ